MLTPRFRALLEEYQRKRWFPEDYPDPFGEFIDYVSEGMISDLLEAWKREKRGSYVNVARYLLQLLPEILFREASTVYRKAMSEELSENVLPEFAFFWIRNSSEERSSQLWNELQRWTGKWENVLLDWTLSMLEFESRHADFHELYSKRLALPEVKEDQLRISRDLFAWQLQNKTGATNYLQLLRYFRLEHWESVAEWGALPALAKSVRETCGISNFPALRASQNPAIQFLFPIQPPNRVLLEHGDAKGPFDAMRFLMELGKGFFYAGMNPENAAEERIAGDPSLPWFWGYMYASLLADPEGAKTFIGLKAEPMPEDTGFILQCLYRHETFLAIYHSDVAGNLKHAQDRYLSLWEMTYSIEPPTFLSLFDLSRSTESLYRSSALLRSQNVIKNLRSKYGYRWFAEKKWIERARDYWWEGYRMTTNDILADLQIPDTLDYPL